MIKHLNSYSAAELKSMYPWPDSVVVSVIYSPMIYCQDKWGWDCNVIRPDGHMRLHETNVKMFHGTMDS